MCGIAGYSLSASSQRRADARRPRLCSPESPSAAPTRSGTRTAAPSGRVSIHKQRSGASALLEQVVAARRARPRSLVHVRDYTKGHPRIEANNHPIRHGAVVGVHNGIIFNDDELMAAHGFERAEPEMTVDSEAIFALAEASRRPRRGARAASRLDGDGLARRAPSRHDLPRPRRRPAALGRHGPRGDASSPPPRPLSRSSSGSSASSSASGSSRRARSSRSTEGKVIERQRFKPDRDFEERALPAVRAPQEGAFCLQRLAALAALSV